MCEAEDRVFTWRAYGARDALATCFEEAGDTLKAPVTPIRLNSAPSCGSIWIK